MAAAGLLGSRVDALCIEFDTTATRVEIPFLSEVSGYGRARFELPADHPLTEQAQALARSMLMWNDARLRALAIAAGPAQGLL